jgi:hypothetical protein
LVKSPPVEAAIELRGEKHEPVLGDAVAWFHQWRAGNSRD